LRGALAYYRAWSPRKSRAVAGPVSVPGLVVGGTRDVIDVAAFREAPSCFEARCEVLVVDGAGHWPHREAEDRFLDRLLPFLRSL
ncbi:MAG TPA: alpha/beta hydrolase, partial [Candidatus Dormibacteraeota bacterium]